MVEKLLKLCLRFLVVTGLILGFNIGINYYFSTPAIASNSTSTNNSPLSAENHSMHISLVLTANINWQQLNQIPQTPEVFANSLVANQVVHITEEKTCPILGLFYLNTLGQDFRNANLKNLDPYIATVNHGCNTIDANFIKTLQHNWQSIITNNPHIKLGFLGDILTQHKVNITAINPGAALAIANRFAIKSPILLHSKQLDLAALSKAINPQQKHLTVLDATNYPSHTVVDLIHSLQTLGPVLFVSVGNNKYPHFIQATGVTNLNTSPGLLYSSTTRTPGLVNISNLPATLLKLLDIPSLSDHPVWTDKNNEPLKSILTPSSKSVKNSSISYFTNKIADEVAQTGATKLVSFNLYALYFIFGFITLVIVIWQFRLKRFTVGSFLCFNINWFPLAVVISNLFPWWRYNFSPYLLAILITIILASLNMWLWKLTHYATLVLLLPTFTVFTLILGIVITNNKLFLWSAFGAPAQIAARFYGMNNEMLSLLLACALIILGTLSSYLLSPKPATHPLTIILNKLHLSTWICATLCTLILLGSIAIIDVLPVWGADFGGFLPLCLAGILLIKTFIPRFNTKRSLIVITVLAIFLFTVAYLDAQRVTSARTHLGKFYLIIFQGQANELLIRKLINMLYTLGAGLIVLIILGLSLCLFLGIVFLVQKIIGRPAFWNIPAVLHKTDLLNWVNYYPTLIPTIKALLISAIIATLLNDSGMLMFAFVFCFAFPFYALHLVGYTQKFLPYPLAHQAIYSV